MVTPIAGWPGVWPSPPAAGWTGEGAPAGVVVSRAVVEVSCREEPDEPSGTDWLAVDSVSVGAAEPLAGVARSDPS